MNNSILSYLLTVGNSAFLYYFANVVIFQGAAVYQSRGIYFTGMHADFQAAIESLQASGYIEFDNNYVGLIRLTQTGHAAALAI